MKGVILAGGYGTRLFPLTCVTNKHLLPVYNEPMIYNPIKTLVNSGITDITLVLGGESVGDFIKLLGDGTKFGAKFNYVYQQKSGGIAEALYLTESIVKGHKIAVILGDNIFESTFKNEISHFINYSFNECYLFLKKVKDPERFGVVELRGFKIIAIDEKPEFPLSNLVVTGLYLYDEKIFDIIKQVIYEKGYSKRGELEITDVNNIYINRGKTTYAKVKGFWSDAGTFDTLLKSSNFKKLNSKREK